MTEIEKQKLISIYISGVSLREISKEYHIGRNNLSKILKEKGILIRNQKYTSRKYFCDNTYFKNINTENKAYWLGFLYADGYISKRQYGDYLGITLKKEDINHLKKLSIDLQSTYPIKMHTGSGYNKSGEFVRLFINSKELVSDLEKHGVVEMKTFKLTFPDIPKELYRHFIRGLLDGDGSIYTSKRDNVLGVHIGGTLEVLKEVQTYFSEFNITKKIIVSRSIYDLHYTGKKAKEVLNILYKDSNIYLDRKYDLYKNINM